MPPDQPQLADPSSVSGTATHSELANAIRFLAADAVEAAKSGHPGMPMGMADVATVLFTQFLKFDASTPDWADRDRFILSAGHGSMLLYALLHLTGYADMTMDQLRNFRQLGSKTAGHPEFGHAAGIETTTGPLGQGLAMSVGFALGERHLNAVFGNELVDHYTYVIAGDGCLMEGVSHEAISMAGHLKLGKLIVLFDDNSISIDGATDLAVSDDQLARFSASGWDVTRVDGHDPQAIAAAIRAAQATATPSLIACKTVIGFGAPKKQGTSSTHGSPLGPEEIAGARAALGWPHEAFVVPDHVLSAWRNAGARSANNRKAWESRLSASPKRAEFDRRQAGTLPVEAAKAMEDFKKKVATDAPKWATRQSSGETLEAIFEVVPELLGGSADLTGSVNTKTKAVTIVNPANYGGRYIHYGVREFGMAAAMNGLALHKGVIPYAGTFLVFADYLRPALRLSALMEQRVVYVLTHDSIGLGEDGPTHQPVETLASLRAIPNVLVLRPADAMETAEAWEAALTNTTGPTVLALSRQGLPAVRTTYSAYNLVARGAYVLAEAEGKRQATVMATGSEVSIALDARKKLQADGIGTAVVSMPSWELFARQDRSYRDQVLGPANARVAIEAAIEFGWERWIGPTGAFIGMKGFGASAPAPDLYKHFGITAEAVVEAVKARL